MKYPLNIQHLIASSSEALRQRYLGKNDRKTTGNRGWDVKTSKGAMKMMKNGC